MFGSLGAPELIIIGIIVILLFGVGKLSGLGKDLGSSVKEFRRAVKDDKDEQTDATQHNATVVQPQQQLPPATQTPAPPPPSNSETKSPNIF